MGGWCAPWWSGYGQGLSFVPFFVPAPAPGVFPSSSRSIILTPETSTERGVLHDRRWCCLTVPTSAQLVGTFCTLCGSSADLNPLRLALPLVAYTISMPAPQYFPTELLVNPGVCTVATARSHKAGWWYFPHMRTPEQPFGIGFLLDKLLCSPKQRRRRPLQHKPAMLGWGEGTAISYCFHARNLRRTTSVTMPIVFPPSSRCLLRSSSVRRRGQ